MQPTCDAQGLKEVLKVTADDAAAYLTGAVRRGPFRCFLLLLIRCRLVRYLALVGVLRCVVCDISEYVGRICSQ